MVFTFKKATTAFLFGLFLAPIKGYSGMYNYQSILIGEKAAGMGGAFTGLSGDPAGCSFYNPATLARMEGTSLSASANLYTKGDVRFGDTQNFAGGAARINQGNIRSVPASAGSIAAFGPFAAGISIISPSYNFFSGAIQNTGTNSTFMNVNDESLWIGGNIALNLSEHQSVGFTSYYTSRFFHRSLTDELRTGSFSKITTEEKTFTNNSLVYVIGYFARFDSNWSLGIRTSFPSIEIAGTGAFYSSTIDSQNPTASTNTVRTEVKSEYRIPTKTAIGVAYSIPYRWTVSLDVSRYGHEAYDDMESYDISDRIRHDPIFNYALGAEIYVESWLRWRLGAFTNLSSRPDSALALERSERVDMVGFSSNLGIFTNDKVSFSIGGYYTGGEGYAIERVGQQLIRIPKSEQIFSLLVGSSYFF